MVCDFSWIYFVHIEGMPLHISGKTFNTENERQRSFFSAGFKKISVCS